MMFRHWLKDAFSLTWRGVLGLVLFAAFWFGVGWYAHQPKDLTRISLVKVVVGTDGHRDFYVNDSAGMEYVTACGPEAGDTIWMKGGHYTSYIDGPVIANPWDYVEPTPTPNCHEPTPTPGAR